MKKIMVGMSGGVDSSAAALILRDSGADVTGVTLKLFSDDDLTDTQREAKVCGALSDAEDARLAAEHLGLKHMVVDMKEDFQNYVIKKFSQSYLEGKTPNPCIECNRHIKFGRMLEYARELGFDGVATGHYAVKEYDERSGRYLLKRPTDKRKDQTYVLYSLTQEQLEHIEFPLGDMEKTDVRALVQAAGLMNCEKPDSQDICFVPDGDYAGFIERSTGINSLRGNFTDTAGNILGEHKGIINYTIGQRKGLGIALGKPRYVVKKDAVLNTVMLGDEEDLYTLSLIAEDVNLISVAEVTKPMRITAKTRYSQNEQPAILTSLGNGEYLVEFDKPQRAITSGQAVVFYDGDVVVGGGTIKW